MHNCHPAEKNLADIIKRSIFAVVITNKQDHGKILRPKSRFDLQKGIW